jgi:hypothetical protein
MLAVTNLVNDLIKRFFNISPDLTSGTGDFVLDLIGDVRDIAFVAVRVFFLTAARKVKACEGSFVDTCLIDAKLFSDVITGALDGRGVLLWFLLLFFGFIDHMDG